MLSLCLSLFPLSHLAWNLLNQKTITELILNSMHHKRRKANIQMIHIQHTNRTFVLSSLHIQPLQKFLLFHATLQQATKHFTTSYKMIKQNQSHIIMWSPMKVLKGNSSWYQTTEFSGRSLIRPCLKGMGLCVSTQTNYFSCFKTTQARFFNTDCTHFVHKHKHTNKSSQHVEFHTNRLRNLNKSELRLRNELRFCLLIQLRHLITIKVLQLLSNCRVQ